MTILITCEHAENRVPELAETCFAAPAAEAALQGPWAADWGALTAARVLASTLNCPLISYPFSRLVVDVNRSLRSPRLFSSYTKKLAAEPRRQLLDRYYHPYRQRLEQVSRRMLDQERFLLHIAVHSFPCFRQGKPKRADAGLLYDPACEPERSFCLDWAEEIYYEIPCLRIRRNYPGRGTADRLTRSLRHRLNSPRYLGIELQLNQAWAARPVAIRDQTFQRLAESLRAIIEHSLPQHAEAA